MYSNVLCWLLYFTERVIQRQSSPVISCEMQSHPLDARVEGTQQAVRQSCPVMHPIKHLYWAGRGFGGGSWWLGGKDTKCCGMLELALRSKDQHMEIDQSLTLTPGSSWSHQCQT